MCLSKIFSPDVLLLLYMQDENMNALTNFWISKQRTNKQTVDKSLFQSCYLLIHLLLINSKLFFFSNFIS